MLANKKTLDKVAAKGITSESPAIKFSIGHE